MHITTMYSLCIEVRKLYMAFNVWVTRWMHGIAPPSRPSHVAAHDWTQPETKTVTKRGCLHKNVARDIDQKFWDGTFELEAFTEYGKDLEYETPVNHARNEFAKNYASLSDDDEKEASLYSYRGFLYCVLSRKITSARDLRSVEFKEHEREIVAAAAAAEDSSELE